MRASLSAIFGIQWVLHVSVSYFEEHSNFLNGAKYHSSIGEKISIHVTQVNMSDVTNMFRVNSPG